MSILQKDRDVIRDGRKDTLQDAEVDLRHRQVQQLYAELTSDDVKMGIKLAEAWHLASTNMATVLEKQETYLRELDDFGVGNGEGRFGGNSDIHIPMAFIVCKTYHARFLEAILGIDPPFSVKPRREDSTGRVQVVEDLMRYMLSSWANQNRGVEEPVDSWIWNWCTTGTGIMKIRWLTKYETYVDAVDVQVPTVPLWQMAPNGENYPVPQFRVEQQEQKVTVKTFDGPQFDFVQMEDFRMVGGGGDPDLADKVMHRSYYTASDLWTKVDQGIFNREAVERVIEGGADDPNTDAYNSLKLQRKHASGEEPFSAELQTDQYQIVECCFKHDVFGSGIQSDVVAWFDLDRGEILGCTYLRRILPSGERPYSVVHFHKRPGEEYGLGLMEILHPMSVELDAMHNIRMDNAMFQSIPFFFYRASGTLDPETIQLEPGAGIPLDNPQTDVYFPNLPNKTIFTAQEEQAVQGYVERLTGISDLSLGVMSGTQGPTRTASGVRALLGENNNNLSVHLRRLNKGWQKVLRTGFHMLQNRVPAGFAFRITGDAGQDVFRQVYDSDLAMEVDFELTANTSNSNKSVQIEVAQQIIQMTMNPLNIQMGVCGPEEIYAAQKNYLSQIGVRDVHRYIKKPQGYQYTPSPQEELVRVAKGEQVPVAPQADHAAFIAFAESILAAQQNNPQGETLTQDQQTAVINQMRQHQAMADAIAQQQAQQAMTQQMQMNQSAAGQSAGPALNPLAGVDPGQVF